MNNIIEIHNLNKRYGKLEVLNDFDLTVEEGSIYGFLGRNGEGKTTTVKILLGLDNKFSGDVTVINMNPVLSGDQIRQRIGYVPEVQLFPKWMTVSQLMNFTSPFYQTWDENYCQHLLGTFHLPRQRRIKHLSRGMVAKVSLVQALSHHPRLLILDDPTMGLDAVVRREFLESIVELIQEGGRTVFFSSHIIDEIERVADYIGILQKGALQLTGSVDEIKSQYKTIVAVFDQSPPDMKSLSGISRIKIEGNRMQIGCNDYSSELYDEILELGVRNIEVLDMSLEDIFVHLTEESRE